MMKLGHITFEPNELLSLARMTDRDVVFISGSLVEGFGNLGSDIDMYVISKHLPTDTLFMSNSNPVKIAELHGVRVDIEYLTYDKIEQLIEKVNQLSFGSETTRYSYLNEEEADFIHRLKIGISLHGQQTFEELRARFDFDTFSRSEAKRRLSRYSNIMEDAVGAYESDDLESAFWMARSAFEFALQGYLSSEGQTHPNAKWMYKKVERLNDPNLMRMYVQVQRPAIQTKQDLADYVENTLSWANDLARKAQR